VSGVRDPDIIRQEIAETRHELGEAVEELAAKTDVKARAREKLTGLQQAAGTLPERAREHPGATVAVTASAIAVVVLARR
jgi:phage shock protein A